jgi:hypothetical protein
MIVNNVTDVSFLSDRGNVFEATFREFGFSCQQVVPQAFGSPYCQPSKLLIIPSGFADPKYYKVLPALERNKEKIKTFIEDGGVVLAFGAMLEDYAYDWLPMSLKYHMQFKTRSLRLAMPDSPAAKLVEPGRKDCDGYFTEHDGETVMTLEDGKPVLVHKKYGEGHIVASSIHEYPDKKFIEWACSIERKMLRL